MTPTSPSERTIHVRIEGQVQGVGYRAWAARTAAQLALAGFVRNRRDGSVEAAFTGPPSGVEEILTLLERGPPAAVVTAVVIVSEGGPPHCGFRVLPTPQDQ